MSRILKWAASTREGLFLLSLGYIYTYIYILTGKQAVDFVKYEVCSLGSRELMAWRKTARRCSVKLVLGSM